MTEFDETELYKANPDPVQTALGADEIRKLRSENERLRAETVVDISDRADAAADERYGDSTLADHKREAFADGFKVGYAERTSELVNMARVTGTSTFPGIDEAVAAFNAYAGSIPDKIRAAISAYDSARQTSPTLDLDAIEARANAAFPGPWSVVSDLPYYSIATQSGSRVVDTVNQNRSGRHAKPGQRSEYGVAQQADADFIAHAREDIPALIAEIRRLRGEGQ